MQSCCGDLTCDDYAFSVCAHISSSYRLSHCGHTSTSTELTFEPEDASCFDRAVRPPLGARRRVIVFPVGAHRNTPLPRASLAAAYTPGAVDHYSGMSCVATSLDFTVGLRS